MSQTDMQPSAEVRVLPNDRVRVDIYALTQLKIGSDMGPVKRGIVNTLGRVCDSPEEAQAYAEQAREAMRVLGLPDGSLMDDEVPG